MSAQADSPVSQPLAARMRPRTLEEFVGQEHIVAPGRLLRRAIQADRLSSLIFTGPPGSGKTTLAMVIANTTRSRFVTLNAVLAGLKDLREAIVHAREVREKEGRRTILFVDEVHRWNKAQQDGLLPWVENGTVILIGATTENPYFSVNPPLVSRSRIFQLRALTPEDLRTLVRRALEDPERGYGTLRVRLEPEALEHWVDVANGDARAVLNALELAVETTPANPEGVIVVDLPVAEESIQRRAVLYDRDGDAHYDTISAFIKSLRGSDPDAALYWLARMVYAGEDPHFIFRRMLILASEDVGLADPQAVGVIVACAEAFDRVGLPEGQFHLAEAALYLALAPKSNAVMGYFEALKAVEGERAFEIPAHLKDASRDRQGFGHGEGYLYPHAFREHWVAQQYLPRKLQGKTFYRPSDQGREGALSTDVARRREAQLAAMVEGVEAGGREIFTHSPKDRARDRWLQRAVGRHGGVLGKIRDRVLDSADLARHAVVLDLHGGTGLLTWEAVRRTPEGGVWALARDSQSAELLRSKALQLPETERPVVMEGDPGDLERLLGEAGEPRVRFDAVVGRNALVSARDPREALEAAAGRLRPEGVVSLAESLLAKGARLYAMVADAASWDPDLHRRWREAEEALYEEMAREPTCWDEEAFKEAFKAAGLEATVECVTFPTRLLLTPALVRRWFPDPQEEGPKGPASYAERLRPYLSAEDLDRIKARFQGHLLGQELPWWLAVAFVRGKRA